MQKKLCALRFFFACRTFKKFSERSENGYSSFNIDLTARVSTASLRTTNGLDVLATDRDGQE